MARFIVGIDLGTSNCAMAYVEPSLLASAPVVDVAVPQLVRPGELAARPLFPSAVYLPFDGEFPPGSLKLPWGEAGRVSGELARWQGSRVANRVITSAKSWLIHPGVDRQAPILPWGASPDVPRLSVVAAQAELLSHLRHSWNQLHPDATLEQQQVVLTIPASFDEAARALTLQAARDAGYELSKLTLLEEPSAAFYDFTSRHRTQLAQALEGLRLVLVVDVGGGTTDFSLVQVAMLPEGPALKRIAVGEHLLLGGDNMDAALARLIEQKVAPHGSRLSAPQWAQAVHAARVAKEMLLGSETTKHSVTLAQGGSKLIGGTLSTELTRDEVRSLVVDGFFPSVTGESLPTQAKRGAVVELGLPFASDAAITRHLVAFLSAHAAAGHQALGQATTREGLPRPDAILLNGGVFNSATLAQALRERVSALWPDSQVISLLEHDSLDLAVARGAAYSGLARRALGKKIGGGAPRAMYAVISDQGVRKGVCLIPRGLEEGETIDLSSRTFSLTVGRPVQFQLVSTTADRLDRPGEIVDVEGEAFKALPPIHTILKSTNASPKGQGERVHVHLVATLTEVGTLELSCVAQDDRRWRLEFELRGAAQSNEVTVTESMPARFTEATTEIERVFGTKPLPVEPKDVKQLVRTLERILGPKESWSVPVLRELWTPLFAGLSKRRRSADHERVMYQLLGYSLRPGTGYPLDGWRCEQTFSLFKEHVTHHGEQPIWAEYWVLWRRIAGGLAESAQVQLWGYLSPHLARRVPPVPAANLPKLKGIQPQALDEMVRTAASLELISADHKIELGAWIVERLAVPETSGGPWVWALGRLGARSPVHGASHRVITAEVAEKWVETLLGLDVKRHDAVPFALAQLARMTGDRSRDLSEPVRAKVLKALDQAPAAWRQMVAEVVHLSAADEARALGDTLPVGLTLQ